jgi:hypothetical protein
VDKTSSELLHRIGFELRNQLACITEETAVRVAPLFKTAIREAFFLKEATAVC